MTTADTKPGNDLGVFDTAALIAMLFDRAAPHLTARELNWIATQAPDCITHHGRNLADTMMTIGCMVNSDEGRWMENRANVSKLLFTLSHQTHVLMELVGVADDARYHLDHSRPK